jgi:hypothetical protein
MTPAIDSILTKNEEPTVDLTFSYLICRSTRMISIIEKATLEVFQRVGSVSVHETPGNAEYLQNAVVNNHCVRALGSISRCEIFHL